MAIDDIREQIAISLSASCYSNWCTILDDTEPGNYGIDDFEFQVEIEDIWVDIPRKTFTFKGGELSFLARMLASSDRDGVDIHYRKVVSGCGTFHFDTARTVEVISFTINEKIDLFEPDFA